MIRGARDAGGKRLVIVGGAGSLEVAPGVVAMNTPDFPEAWKPAARGHSDALEVYRREAGDLGCTFLTPAAVIRTGTRPGHYRTGGEQMVVNEKGESIISSGTDVRRSHTCMNACLADATAFSLPVSRHCGSSSGE